MLVTLPDENSQEGKAIIQLLRRENIEFRVSVSWFDCRVFSRGRLVPVVFHNHEVIEGFKGLLCHMKKQ